MFNNHFQRSLIISLALHALGILLFMKVYEAFLVTRAPLMMELTLIGRVSQGKGLGSQSSQAGEVSGAAEGAGALNGEFSAPSVQTSNPPMPPLSLTGEAIQAKPLKESDQSGASHESAYLESVRKSAPIGLVPKKTVTRKIKTTVGMGYLGTAGTPSGNVDIEGELSARGIKRRVTPSYPDWAQKQGVEGTIQYRVTVLPNGLLRDNISLEQTSGYRELDRASYSALVQWEFDPLPTGTPQVEQSGLVSFQFHFQGR